MLLISFFAFQYNGKNPGSAHMGLLSYSPYKWKVSFSFTFCYKEDLV